MIGDGKNNAFYGSSIKKSKKLSKSLNDQYFSKFKRVKTTV